MFALFQDELEARKSLRAFCLQPKPELNILLNLFFEFAVKTMSKGFLKMILLWIRSLLVYKLKPHKLYARLKETEKKKTHQRQ